MRKGKGFYFMALVVCTLVNSLSVGLCGSTVAARAAGYEITVTGPTENEVVYPYSDKVKVYVTTENADIRTYYQSGNKTNGDASIAPVSITWDDSADSGVTKYVVEYAAKEDYSDAITVTQEDVSVKQIAVYNLYKASTYYVRVTAYAGDAKLGQAESTFQTTDQGPRIMNVDGAYNVRDLGGYTTTDGRVTLQGMIFRGSELDGNEYQYGGSNGGPNPNTCERISEEGEQYMSSVLGIKTDLDIRNPAQLNKVNKTSTSPISSATRVNHMTGYKLDDTSYQKSYKAIFELLADESNYPVYFHCWAGADRTGRLSYMINALLGVPEEDLIRDYEMTSYSIFGPKVWTDWDTSDYASMDINAIDPNVVKAADSHRTLEFQYHLNLYGGDATTPAGKVENYLVNICGVSPEDIASFRAIMLGGSISGDNSDSGEGDGSGFEESGDYAEFGDSGEGNGEGDTPTVADDAVTKTDGSGKLAVWGVIGLLAVGSAVAFALRKRSS